MENLINDIKKNEGFSGNIYKDTLGFDTIGYGTKLPLNEDEALLILEYRLKAKIKELEQKEPFVNKLPRQVQEILAEMCYQMGVEGVLKFKKMWEALKRFDYIEASKQMMYSLWAKQTPNRAKKLSAKMRIV